MPDPEAPLAGYTMMPNALAFGSGARPTQVLVYLAVRRLAGEPESGQPRDDRHTCYASVETIGDLAGGLKPTQTRKALGELVRLGFIIERKDSPNRVGRRFLIVDPIGKAVGTPSENRWADHRKTAANSEPSYSEPKTKKRPNPPAPRDGEEGGGILSSTLGPEQTRTGGPAAEAPRSPATASPAPGPAEPKPDDGQAQPPTRAPDPGRWIYSQVARAAMNAARNQTLAEDCGVSAQGSVMFDGHSPTVVLETWKRVVNKKDIKQANWSAWVAKTLENERRRAQGETVTVTKKPDVRPQPEYYRAPPGPSSFDRPRVHDDPPPPRPPTPMTAEAVIARAAELKIGLHDAGGRIRISASDGLRLPDELRAEVIAHKPEILALLAARAAGLA